MVSNNNNIPKFAQRFVGNAQNAKLTGQTPEVRHNPMDQTFDVRMALKGDLYASTTIRDVDKDGKLTVVDFNQGGASGAFIDIDYVKDKYKEIDGRNYNDVKKASVRVKENQAANVSYSEADWKFRNASADEKEAAARSPQGLPLGGQVGSISDRGPSGFFAITAEQSTNLWQGMLAKIKQGLNL
jgi:hypothetical protein